MEKLKSTVLIGLVLLTSVSMFQTLQNKANADIPFIMPSKSFVLEVLESNSTIVDYQGTKYINLSMAYGSHPMGIIYDSNKNVVYIALYPESSNTQYIYGIAEVNVTSKNLKIYRFPCKIDDNYYGPMPWTITIDDNGNLWISIYDYCATPYHPTDVVPYLAKLETEIAVLTIYYVPKELCWGKDIKYYDSYIWYVTQQGLSKINLNGVIEEFYPRYFSDGFMKLDADCFWISAWTEGFVTRFNLTSKSFDVNITGLNKPLGVEADENYVYVAESSRPTGIKGTIAVIDKETHAIQRKQTAEIVNQEQGTCYILKDSDGNLWWTDLSGHVGYYDVADNLFVYDAIGPYCYFMTEAPNTIWFSVKGSAYIGLISVSRYDITGDGYVGIDDIFLVATHFGETPEDPSWNPKCDVNRDKYIGIDDIFDVARHFGED